MAGLWLGKYPIVLRRDGTVVTTPYFVLLERDPAFSAAIRAYAEKHEEIGSDPQFVEDLFEWANDVDGRIRDYGDPDAPRHRTDDPVVIAWARAVHSKSA